MTGPASTPPRPPPGWAFRACTTVLAPSAAASRASAGRGEHPSPDACRLPGNDVRVLVVDDHPEALAAICELLEAQGHDVVGVACGRAALDEAAARKPDIVLLDVRLGEESGLDVARALISSDRDLHVVLLSMNPVSAAAVRASGARSFVTKEALATTDLSALRDEGNGR